MTYAYLENKNSIFFEELNRKWKCYLHEYNNINFKDYPKELKELIILRAEEKHNIEFTDKQKDSIEKNGYYRNNRKMYVEAKRERDEKLNWTTDYDIFIYRLEPLLAK